MKKHTGKLLEYCCLLGRIWQDAGTKNAGNRDGGSAAAETKLDSVKSKVKFDGVYTAGDTLKIQMTLDKDGNCDYGYTGIYQLSTSEAGYRVLNLIYYGQEGEDDAQTQLAYDYMRFSKMKTALIRGANSQKARNRILPAGHR